jgi:hypothetical protein
MTGASPTSHENPPLSPFACLWQGKDAKGEVAPPFLKGRWGGI